MSSGLQAGIVTVVTVVFGQFATKFTSLPLFLAFRRTAILASITVLYFINGERPTQSDTIATALLTLGAIIASLESLDQELSGIVLTSACNFSHSLQNLYLERLNESKTLSTFGKFSEKKFLNRTNFCRNQLFLRCMRLDRYKHLQLLLNRQLLTNDRGYGRPG